MRKGLIIGLVICAVLGLLIPFLAYYRQFYYLLLLGAVAVAILILKRGKITIYDWLVLLIFAIPFHTLRIGGRVQFVRLTEIAFIPFFLWWLAERSLRLKEPLKIRKEFLMILGFLVINIISTSKSMHPLMSINRVFIIGYLIIFCYLVSNIIRTRGWLLFIIKAMILFSALSAILAMLQAFLPRFHILPTGSLVSLGKVTLYRASAGWKDPNYYALYLAMNAALTLSFLLSRQFKKRRFLNLCLLLQWGGLVATFSRMAHICFFIVMLFMLATYGRRRTALSMLLIMVVLLAGLWGSMEAIYARHPGLQAYVFREPNLGMLQAYPRLILVHRWDAYRANWRMFLDNPLLGVGPFMSIYNYAKYRPSDALWYERTFLASHNQYLQLLSEKGIFGLVTFMGFILLVWRKLTSHIKQRMGTQEGMILIGLKGSLMAYLIACLVGNMTHEMQFWLTMGLCLAFFNILEQKQYGE